MCPEQMTIRDRSAVPLLLRKRRAPFRLELEPLSPTESAEWERRLRRWRSSCGCGASAAFLIGSLLGYGALCALDSPRVTHGFFPRIGQGLLVVVAATIVGKILGLAYARARLARTVAELDARLTEHPAAGYGVARGD